MYVYPISMSTSLRLSRFNLKIYEVGHQEYIGVDRDVASH
jgi:phosphatidylserine synthase